MRISAIFLVGAMQLSIQAQAAEPKFADDIPYSKITFEVYDAKSKDLISSGTESIQFDGKNIQKTTQYFSADSQHRLLQTEDSQFDDKTLRIINYSLSNESTGESVLLKMPVGSDDAAVTYKANAKSRAEENTYKWTSQSVIGKTLHHIIVRQWQSILKDEPAKFELFVPMKRDHFAFRVRKDSSYTKDGVKYYVLSLEPQNWAIRSLVLQMDFHYREADGVARLDHYEGATTITIDGKEDRKVTIDFHYQRAAECGDHCPLAH